MDDFFDKLIKIQAEYLGRMRLLFILDFISIFSIFYAILIISNVEFLLRKLSITLPIQFNVLQISLASVIAVAGAFLMHRNDRKINFPLLIEKKYPEMREKLRTAYDNRSETNVVIDSLKALVSEGISAVSASKLLAKSAVITKILVTIIFISGVFVISMNPQEYRIPEKTLTDVTDILTGNENKTEPSVAVGPPVDVDKMNFRGGGDIFGQPKIASIEGKNIDLTLYTGIESGFEVSPSDQRQNQFISSSVFPVDIVGANVSDGGYSVLMKKTENEKELIKDYAVERSKI